MHHYNAEDYVDMTMIAHTIARIKQEKYPNLERSSKLVGVNDQCVHK